MSRSPSNSAALFGGTPEQQFWSLALPAEEVSGCEGVKRFFQFSIVAGAEAQPLEQGNNHHLWFSLGRGLGAEPRGAIQAGKSSSSSFFLGRGLGGEWEQNPREQSRHGNNHHLCFSLGRGLGGEWEQNLGSSPDREIIIIIIIILAFPLGRGLGGEWEQNLGSNPGRKIITIFAFP